MSENNKFADIGSSKATSATVTNIVVSADFGEELDLESIQEKLQTADYEPKVFPGLTYQLTESATANIFESGKVNITGIQTQSELEEVETQLNSFINDLGIETTVENNIDIVNIVVNAEYVADLRLEQEILKLGLESTQYEPETFPGIVWRVETDDTSGVLLIFGSGKIVIPGLTNIENVHKLLEEFEQKIGINEDGTLKDPTTV